MSSFFHLVVIGGKVYLAKDELLTDDLFRKMYPEYANFVKIKQQFDPDELFISDIYRRLFLKS